MNSTAVMKVENPTKEEESRGKTTQEKIENTYTDELILGICSPIGSLREPIINLIKEKLENEYDYDVRPIKLSDFIKEYYKETFSPIQGETVSYSTLMHKIAGGDYLRKEYKSNSLLVELAIEKIRREREVIKTEDIKGRRVCYIINSLKNIEELKLLRSVYQDIFYLFSIFSPDEERIKKLIDNGLSQNEAHSIIDTDEYENIDHGQNVRETFVDGDFFIRSSEYNKESFKDKIERYLHLIFDSQIITPTYQETAMYFAKSAAGNSACLSRQVGATITDSKGVPIAQGWNDVPKFGGNLYHTSDIENHRCFKRGWCSNVTHRNDIIEDILDKIREVLPSEASMTVSNMPSTELEAKIQEIIRNSKFKSIIEYSRSIHAEMHAIIIGSQMTGSKMVNGDLYCTTYPCHNCARHIVLAGIKNIYYIEPYKKSLCLTLHNDSLTEDEGDEDKVRILLYDGVAPRRYLEFFSMSEERKDKDGSLINIELSTKSPKKRLSLQAIPDLENQAIHVLYESGFLKIDSDEEK